MSSTVGGIRIVDMPDLGVVTDDSSVVGEHAGSGLFRATALGNYLATSGQFVPTINPITGVPGMLPFKGDIYQSANAYDLKGSLTIRDQPYGYYDTGTLLSIVATTLPLTSSRAGLASGFENGVPNIAGYGSLDSVNIYSGTYTQPPPLVLRNCYYDATHVYPQQPLTAAQMKMLRVNMYVITNSIDTTVSTTPAVPNGMPPERHYASYVTGWATDGTAIDVIGWTVPGSGHSAGGQVPSNTFDPGASVATAYFGAMTNVFHANFMSQHNPAMYPDSRINTYQGIEFDFVNYDTHAYAMRVMGISMDYSAAGGARPTDDSYGIKVVAFPTNLILTEIAGYTNVQLDSFAFNIIKTDTPGPWAGSPTTNLTWESQNRIDYNVLRLQCWTSRDVNVIGGWEDASVHIGLRIDGDPYKMTGGSPMAQIVWNAHNWAGGLQLQNQAGVAGLTIDVNARVYPNVVNAANDAAAATAGVPIGAMYRNGSVAMVRVA